VTAVADDPGVPRCSPRSRAERYLVDSRIGSTPQVAPAESPMLGHTATFPGPQSVISEWSSA
jgi:hypothetical protein